MNLSACGIFKKHAEVTNINLTLISTPDLNPNLFGRPSPLYITVFQLQDAAAFNQANFLKLSNKPEETLGANLLLKKTILILPDTRQNISIDLDANTKQVGVVAAFTKLEGARWRMVIPVSKKIKKLTLKFNQDSIIFERKP
jgi:type VI secretion system protein VasD